MRVIAAQLAASLLLIAVWLALSPPSFTHALIPSGVILP